MRIPLTFFILLIYFFSYSQNTKHNISFELGYGINRYSMGDLNEFYIDSFASQVNPKIVERNIKSGQSFNLSLRYKPVGLFDIGLYGNYQYGNVKSSPVYVETDEFGAMIAEHQGSYELRTEAIGVGISSTWYLSHLLNLQNKEKKYLQCLHFGVELSGGVGFSKAKTEMRFKTFPIGSFYEYFDSRDFQGQIGLKVEYDFTKTQIFSTFGIRFGYQYFKTKTLRDRLDNDWVVLSKYPVNLDFSGFYFGIYLKIGK